MAFHSQTSIRPHRPAEGAAGHGPGPRPRRRRRDHACSSSPSSAPACMVEKVIRSRRRQRQRAGRRPAQHAVRRQGAGSTRVRSSSGSSRRTAARRTRSRSGPATWSSRSTSGLTDVEAAVEATTIATTDTDNGQLNTWVKRLIQPASASASPRTGRAVVRAQGGVRRLPRRGLQGPQAHRRQAQPPPAVRGRQRHPDRADARRSHGHAQDRPSGPGHRARRAPKSTSSARSSKT